MDFIILRQYINVIIMLWKLEQYTGIWGINKSNSITKSYWMNMYRMKIIKVSNKVSINYKENVVLTS